MPYVNGDLPISGQPPPLASNAPSDEYGYGSSVYAYSNDYGYDVPVKKAGRSALDTSNAAAVVKPAADLGRKRNHCDSEDDDDSDDESRPKVTKKPKAISAHF